jgi:hypothetical protein
MQDALGRMYEVFGRLPRPARIGGCPSCVRRLDPHLLDRPVRSLEPEALRCYASDVLLTMGSTEDFRYFLPRLLECAVADLFCYPNPEIVFGKLAIADWQTWPGEQRAAVGNFLAAWWSDFLAGDRSGLTIGTVVCCLGATATDMTSYLEREI